MSELSVMWPLLAAHAPSVTHLKLCKEALVTPPCGTSFFVQGFTRPYKGSTFSSTRLAAAAPRVAMLTEDYKLVTRLAGHLYICAHEWDRAKAR
jgi:hypothetical protein